MNIIDIDKFKQENRTRFRNVGAETYLIFGRIDKDEPDLYRVLDYAPKRKYGRFKYGPLLLDLKVLNEETGEAKELRFHCDKHTHYEVECFKEKYTEVKELKKRSWDGFLMSFILATKGEYT